MRTPSRRYATRREDNNALSFYSGPGKQQQYFPKPTAVGARRVRPRDVGRRTDKRRISPNRAIVVSATST